jgi:hypothetical protein
MTHNDGSAATHTLPKKTIAKMTVNFTTLLVNDGDFIKANFRDIAEGSCEARMRSGCIPLYFSDMATRNPNRSRTTRNIEI